MVLADSGCQRRRKAHPGELWSRGSLEWSIWGILATIADQRGVDRIYRTGGALVDRGSKSHQPYSQALWYRLQEAG